MNNKALNNSNLPVVDPTLFDVSVFDPSSIDPNWLVSMTTGLDSYFDSTQHTYAITGYPAWGAAMVIDDYTIVPTVFDSAEVSLTYFLFQEEVDGTYTAYYFAPDDLPMANNLIGPLTYPLLTSSAQQRIGTSFELIDIGFEDDPEPVDDIQGLKVCVPGHVLMRHCIGVHQDGVGSFCCNCEDEVVTSGISHCYSTNIRQVGSFELYDPIVGIGSDRGGPIDDDDHDDFWENFAERMDSIRRFAPDHIINEVDCNAEPCLCETIDMFNFPNAPYSPSSNISTKISDMISATFGFANNADLTFTTSAQSGDSIDDDVYAIHYYELRGAAAAVQYPINGIFNSTIAFNSNNIACTRAHLASTLMHEGIHAYISHQERALTASEFALRYPLYSTGGLEADHAVMAESYIDVFTQTLLTMFPDLEYEMANALAWDGLGDTDAWNNMPLEERNDIVDLLRTATCRGSANGGPHSPTDLEQLGLSPCVL